MMPTVGWTFVTYEKLKPNIKYQLKFGGVAQLGEHLPCKQGVRSSILLISTSVCETNASIHVMLTTSRRLFRQGAAFYGSKSAVVKSIVNLTEGQPKR